MKVNVKLSVKIKLALIFLAVVVISMSLINYSGNVFENFTVSTDGSGNKVFGANLKTDEKCPPCTDTSTMGSGAKNGIGHCISYSTGDKTKFPDSCKKQFWEEHA
jgi:hypothetical protein